MLRDVGTHGDVVCAQFGKCLQIRSGDEDDKSSEWCRAQHFERLFGEKRRGKSKKMLTYLIERCDSWCRYEHD